MTLLVFALHYPRAFRRAVLAGFVLGILIEELAL